MKMGATKGRMQEAGGDEGRKRCGALKPVVNVVGTLLRKRRLELLPQGEEARKGKTDLL
jgi:hypothetical protein